MSVSKRGMYRVVCYLFDGFEMLDVFGPLEMFSVLARLSEGGIDQRRVVVETVGFKETAKSSGGPHVKTDFQFETLLPLANKIDLFIVPGGLGTRSDVENEHVLDALRSVCLDDHTAQIMSICTGSALLAKSGLLDGLEATTNKLAFDWVASNGPNVNWQKSARWVNTPRYHTSSGVAAGCDLALDLIGKEFGEEMATRVANAAEYIRNRDRENDPFAI
mmetsp:Transcript_8289/g.13447  ORF Transcript_8289/g.13447 Transcript_8289/m.13447 type:complete len:219 (+) Transcript_8289:806-1462(+)